MPKPVSVRAGQVEFLKLNLEKREWRDAYQWLLALSWPEFAALIAGIYIVINVEIINGMFGLAVMTGLIFVRFSRPAARILFSRSIVIGPLDGRPTLMLRVGNLRAQSMVEAEFRIMFTRDEPIAEGDTFRHFYDLKLHFDRLIAFPE